MLRKSLYLSIIALFSVAFAGCHLYVDDHDDYDYPDEYQDGRRGEPNTGDSCATNYDCAAGCFCSSGVCEEAGFCRTDNDCAVGYSCDERESCVPDSITPPPPPPPVGPTCQSEVTCDVEAPICPAGTTPIIENGCYSNACMDKSECPDGAPFACSDLNDDENACLAHDSCEVVYNGVNCTSSDGSACTNGQNDCTCEAYQYARCQ